MASRYYGINKRRRNHKHAQQQIHTSIPGLPPVTQEEFENMPPEVQQYFHNKQLENLQKQSRVDELNQQIQDLQNQIDRYQKPGRASRNPLIQLLMWPGALLLLFILFIFFFGLLVGPW